jgi:hypothetical protein
MQCLWAPSKIILWEISKVAVGREKFELYAAVSFYSVFVLTVTIPYRNCLTSCCIPMHCCSANLVMLLQVVTYMQQYTEIKHQSYVQV